MQFLLEGARAGERCMYITLSENQRELDVVPRRHGWSLNGIDVFELISPEATLDPSRELTVLHPSEMELDETTQTVFDRVRRFDPRHVVFESPSEMRLLAQNPFRYRRQILPSRTFLLLVAAPSYCWMISPPPIRPATSFHIAWHYRPGTIGC
jgi:circadian clock protein KaiC